MRPIRIAGPEDYRAPDPVVHDLKPELEWWKKAIAGAIAMFAAAASSYAGSHWGGVTNDQLKVSLKEQEDRITDRIDKAVLTAKKDSDEMKAYVDKKTAPAPLAKKAKRPKISEPTGGTSE